MKALFFTILFSLTLGAHAQDSAYEWKERIIYPIDSTGIWTTDVLGNLYVYSNQVINKFDSSGVLKFSQSIKSLGNINEIQVLNSMKLVTFSEEQQLICYLDNTLTVNGDCLELDDKEVDFATAFAVSSRPDYLWVYDQMNSQLRLIATGADTRQQQSIANIRGLLNAEHIQSLEEHNNQLYVFVNGKGIFIFDTYGSLVKSILSENIKDMEANETFLYLLKEEQLLVRKFETGREMEVNLPLSGISEIHIDSKSIYFRTQKAIHKYDLVFLK